MVPSALLVLLAVVATREAAASPSSFQTDFTGHEEKIVYSKSHGASYVYDAELGATVLELNGAGGHASVPAVKFQQTDFEIEMWFKSSANGKQQVLFGDWSKPWQFMIAIKPNGQIAVTLRRNINSAGSDPNQDLLTATGGSVLRDHWQHLVVSYSHATGTCVVYLGCVVVAKVTTKWPNHDLQHNGHSTYQVGYKLDSNSNFFKGRLSFLMVTKANHGAISHMSSIMGSFSSGSALYQSRFSGLKDHINRVNTGASFAYDAQVHRKVLVLDGARGYALTPAVKFQRKDFTIEILFKSTANGKVQTIFGDWSKPWQFLINILTNGHIQVILRRNINSAGSDPNQDLLSLTGGSVARDQWQYLVVTYDQESGTCVLHLNGKSVTATTKWPDHSLQENSHSTYQLGVKLDSGSSFFKGSIGFLRISNRFYQPHIHDYHHHHQPHHACAY